MKKLIVAAALCAAVLPRMAMGTTTCLQTDNIPDSEVTTGQLPVNPAETVVEPPEGMSLILLIGQSNMAGRATPIDDSPIARAYKMDRDNNWTQARAPFHYDRTNAGMSMANEFVRRYLVQHPTETVGIVPCAVGGSRLATWVNQEIDGKPNVGANFRRALARVTAAKAKGNFVAILWHQGEAADSALTVNQIRSYYPACFGEMIAAFRTAMEDDDVPVILGEVGRFYAPNNDTERANRINTVLNEIPGSVPNSACASSAELMGHIGDATHFNLVSAQTLGARYYSAYANLTDGADLPANVQILRATYDAAGLPQTMRLGFPPANHPRSLLLAFGPADGGDIVDSWAERVYLTTLAANIETADITFTDELRSKFCGSTRIYYRLLLPVAESVADGYLSVPYLQADGNQLIDTRFKPGPKSSCEVDLAWTNLGGNRQSYAFMSRSKTMGSLTASESFFEFTVNGTAYFSFCVHDAYYNGTTQNTGFYTTSNQATGDVRYKALVDAATPKLSVTPFGGAEIDFTSGYLQQANISRTKDAADNLYLFKAINGDLSLAPAQMFRGKFYGCVLKDDGETVRDLVPACKLATGELGLYDRSGKSEEPFYQNSGPKPFLNAVDLTGDVSDCLVFNPIQVTRVGCVNDGLASVSLAVAPLDVSTVAVLAWDEATDQGGVLTDWSHKAILSPAIPAGETVVSYRLPANLRGTIPMQSYIRVFRLQTSIVADGYLSVPYLQADGYQLIDTGFKPGPKSSCEVDLAWTSLGTPTFEAIQSYAFMSRSQTMGNLTKDQSFFEFAATKKGYYSFCVHDAYYNGTTKNTDFYTTSNQATSDVRYKALVDAATPKISVTPFGGAEIDFTSGYLQQANISRTKNAADNLYLFKAINGDLSLAPAQMFRGKFYGCVLKDDGETVRDLVPACKLATGELGLYDRSGKSEEPFYQNSASKAFLNTASWSSEAYVSATVSAQVQDLPRKSGLAIILR